MSIKGLGRRCRIRAGIVHLNEVLPHITGRDSNDKHKRSYCGHRVKMTGSRLNTFKDNIKCVQCGIEGKHFAVEKHKKDKSYHLNLYAVDEYGTEVLMTRDHVVPLAKGGKDNYSNYQTMCCICNEEKADKLGGEEKK
jgi:5-methylcytosine-specific restriction endonuclease McrA